MKANNQSLQNNSENKIKCNLINFRKIMEFFFSNNNVIDCLFFLIFGKKINPLEDHKK